MKSKFLAGVIATVVSLVVVVGLALFLALVLDIEPSKSWFTTTAAFLTIGTFLWVYGKLKPKAPPVVDEFGEVVENPAEPEIKQITSEEFKRHTYVTLESYVELGFFCPWLFFEPFAFLLLQMICLKGLQLLVLLYY